MTLPNIITASPHPTTPPRYRALKTITPSVGWRKFLELRRVVFRCITTRVLGLWHGGQAITSDIYGFEIQHQHNEYIVKRIPILVRNLTSDSHLIVIHSFDVNRPGAEVDELKGVLRLGQEVEICPGIVTKDTQGRNRCKPIFSRIVSLHAENNHLQFAVPGGLIGVGTKIDATLCRADRPVGQLLGAVPNRI